MAERFIEPDQKFLDALYFARRRMPYATLADFWAMARIFNKRGNYAMAGKMRGYIREITGRA